MKELLLVGVGGGIGAVARFQLGDWVGSQSPDARFPFGTFVVNVLGCLVAGALAGLAARSPFCEDARQFLFVGLIGGFTTFSAFGLETVALLRRGETTVAELYVGFSVLVGIFALWAALKLASSSTDR
jgi:fluoride exporter